jgi:phosphoglucosamine mutase
VVDGDEVLFIIANSKKREGRLQGGVVGTLMTNFGLEKALNQQNIPFQRAAIGDRYVLEMLRKEGWLLGGETSGHIICLEQTTTGDAIVAALQVLHELISTDQDLHTTKQGMTKYPQTLINVPVMEKSALEKSPIIQQAIKDAEQDLAGNGRILLRPSGTEPLVRVMVEGPDGSQVRQLAKQIASTVAENAGSSPAH